MQIGSDPLAPNVWDPTYFEYYKIIYTMPPGDWYKTSYQFLINGGTSSPLFSHSTNTIFPMDNENLIVAGAGPSVPMYVRPKISEN